MSSLHRITGATLSGAMYVFGAAYLVSPVFGWHLDSATMAAAFGSLPVAAKVLTKVSLFFWGQWEGGLREKMEGGDEDEVKWICANCG
jgi:hypothetical protein